MDRAELDPAAVERARNGLALRPGVGIVELLGDALLEQIEMLGQHDAGLDDMQIVQLALVGLGERTGEEVGLLLVVAFETDPVARPDDRLQQLGGVVRRHQLALGEAAASLEPLLAIALFDIPCGHASVLGM